MIINGNNLTLVSESDIDENGEFTIPEGITIIGQRAFFENKKVKKINNLSQIESIRECAFGHCESLESFYIGSLLESIGEDAFFNCKSLRNFNINPDNKSFIEIDGYLYTKELDRIIAVPNDIEVLNIPEGVRTIDSVFENSKVREINMPSTIYFSSAMDIGFNLYTANELEKITISDNNPYYKVVDGIVYDKKQETVLFCPARVKKLKIAEGTKNLLLDCAFALNDSLEEIYIPSTFKNFFSYETDNSIAGLKHLKRFIVSEDNEEFISIDEALYSKDGKKLYNIPAGKENSVITIPEGTEIIGISAIMGSNVKKIIFPKSLRSIEIEEYNGAIECPNLEEIEITDENGRFAFKNGVLYDLQEKRVLLCTKNVKELNITRDLKPISYKKFLKYATSLETINIEEGVDVPLEIFDSTSQNLKKINASAAEKNRIFEYLLSNGKNTHVVSNECKAIERIKQSEIFKTMMADNTHRNVDLFLYRMVNSIGEEEANKFFNTPNLDSETIKRLLEEKEEKYLNLFETRYKIEGKFGVAIELLKFINDYSEKNNQGQKNSLEQRILRTLNRALENRTYNSIYETLKNEYSELDADFLEELKEKERRINGHLIDQKLNENEEEITEAISKISNAQSIVRRQQKPIYVKVKKAIRTSFANKGTIDLEDIKNNLIGELENSSPYIRQHANIIVANTINLLSNGELGRKIDVNAFDCMAEVKSQIGNKWRYKIECAMNRLGYSLQSFPKEISQEELSKIQKFLELPQAPDTSPVATLKDKDKAKEAYQLLKEIDYPGILTFQQIHDMFGSVTYPYSDEFKKYFKQHREEFLSHVELYEKFGVIQRKFDELINKSELKNVYREGKLTVDQIIDYFENNIIYDNQREGDEELARYSKMFNSATSDEDFSYIQKIFDIVRKRERSSIPPMNIQKSKFRGRMLSPDDILNMFAGDITTCCQKFNDVGEASMLLGSIEENAGIFVIEELDENGNQIGIIGQSLTLRQKGTGGHYDRLTFDNIEIANAAKNELSSEERREILEIYKQAAKQAIKRDNEFLSDLLKKKIITQEQYESLRLKEVIAGTGYNDLEELSELEEAKVVVPDEAKNQYIGINQIQYPWLDSTDGEAPNGSDFAAPVILAQSERKMNDKTPITKLSEIPLWYRKNGKVLTKRSDEISEEDIDIIRTIEAATYRDEQQLMTKVNTEDDLKEVYNCNNPVVKIGSNNDWYLLYDEQDDYIDIKDLSVYGSLKSERNFKLEENDLRLAIAESTYEMYKLLLENEKKVHCNATIDTSYRIIKKMAKKGLIQLKDTDGNDLALQDERLINIETGEELKKRNWDSDSEIEMIDLEVIPNKRELEKEFGKVQRYLYSAQSLYRMKGTEKEEGLDELRDEIR